MHPNQVVRVPTAATTGQGDGKLALALGVAGALGTALTLPFSNTLMPALALTGKIAAVASVGQGAMVFGLAWAGLRMGRSLGLDAPWLRARFGGPAVENPRFKRDLVMATASGIVLGALILSVGLVAPVPMSGVPLVSRWLGLLAAVGGPVVDEVTFQLFVMTGVAWVLDKMTGHRAASIVAGNVVGALAFGAAHLPGGIALFGAMTPALAFDALVANGILALVSGYLFWKKGFEYSLALHFGANLALYVLMNGT